MKNKVLAIVAAASFLAPVVFAQGGPHTPPTPATMVQHLVDHLTKEGVIDASQQSAASACLLPAATSNASIQTMLRADHKQLQMDLESDNLGSVETDIKAISMLESEIPGNNATALTCLINLPLTSAEAATLAKGRGFWGLGLGPGPGGPRGFGGRGPQ